MGKGGKKGWHCVLAWLTSLHCLCHGHSRSWSADHRRRGRFNRSHVRICSHRSNNCSSSVLELTTAKLLSIAESTERYVIAVVFNKAISVAASSSGQVIQPADYEFWVVVYSTRPCTHGSPPRAAAFPPLRDGQRCSCRLAEQRCPESLQVLYCSSAVGTRQHAVSMHATINPNGIAEHMHVRTRTHAFQRTYAWTRSIQ